MGLEGMLATVYTREGERPLREMVQLAVVAIAPTGVSPDGRCTQHAKSWSATAVPSE
jgi:hypothetical protein